MVLEVSKTKSRADADVVPGRLLGPKKQALSSSRIIPETP
jgi:hypothetical protein